MNKTGKTGLLAGITKQFARLASRFREKPQVTLDDFILEHLMQYHGLVGSSPENQRKFKDVRADINDALHRKSSVEMAIALKLPPLFWDDKLENIFAEAHSTMANQIRACLVPEGDRDMEPPESDPLRHPDWRVRANAARILGYLKMKDAAPHLVQALEDQSETQKAAFMHIAYGLARLRTDTAREALTTQLYNEEPWFRVDAAGALAQFPLPEVQTALMKAVVAPHQMSDYVSLTIARTFTPQTLLSNSDALLLDGATEVILGVLQAVRGPFDNQVVYEVQLPQTLPRLRTLVEQRPTARGLRAMVELSDWIVANGEDFEVSDDILEIARTVLATVASESDKALIIETIKTNKGDTKISDAKASDLSHAIVLAARFQLAAAAPFMVPLVSPESPVVNTALDAIAALNYAEAGGTIVSLIGKVVDVTARVNKAALKQSTFEEDVQGTKTYWHALGALGSIPTVESAECLLEATNDFAADKRQQAVASLAKIGAVPDIKAKYDERIRNTIWESLGDPAPAVQAAALTGVANMEYLEFIPEVTKLAGSKDTTVARQAAATLRDLAAKGHADKVSSALAGALRGERDMYKKQRLERLQASLR